MLNVGYVLEKRLDVNTHVRIRVCVILLPLLEGRICSTVLHAPAIIDSVVTSDLIRMCHNWRERFV